MGFLRRRGRRSKGAGGKASPSPSPPPKPKSSTSSQPPVHRTSVAGPPSTMPPSLRSGRISVAASPAPGAPSSSKSTRTSASSGPPALNQLPPGMPAMPEKPPEYARLAERKVSDIDERFNASRRSLSLDSADSRGSRSRSRSRSRLRRALARPRSRRSVSFSSTGSAALLDDVPAAESAGEPSVGDASSRGLLALAAGISHVPSEYDQALHAPAEAKGARMRLSDLNTKGRLVLPEETVREPVRVHDERVSFVVPHGWGATRTPWGFYLVSGDCLGFIMASAARDAGKHVIDTQKLAVLSDVHVMSSPLFESKHRAVVQYASIELEGRGIIQYDDGFYPGATVFGLCGPRSMHDKLRKIEERLAATAVVVDLPASFEEEKVKLAGMNKRYEPSTMLGLSTGTNCVMQ